MSSEEAKRLIRRMDSDEAFREQLLAPPDVAARLQFAAAEGYDVTEAEVAYASAELSQVELDAFAAGAGETDCYANCCGAPAYAFGDCPYH